MFLAYREFKAIKMGYLQETTSERFGGAPSRTEQAPAQGDEENRNLVTRPGGNGQNYGANEQRPAEVKAFEGKGVTLG